MEMKEVLNREGRDAKNIMMYQLIEDAPIINTTTTNITGKISPLCGTRKPPMAPLKMSHANGLKKSPTEAHINSRLSVKLSKGPRVRSASTGRDKKSELQARYWALLFGNLQRAVNEIYQTVECYENISSCQEAILVLENYVRDFKALGEWFKVSWDYESRPLQQRPQSLAWEVRKSNPLPRVRAKSLSSPVTLSGKSSPCGFYCNSGKSSPCDNVSPKKGLRAVRVNVRDLFAANKSRADTKEPPPPQQVNVEPVQVEIHMEGRCHQFAQTDMEDDYLTLADILEREKQREEEKLLASLQTGEECAFLQVDEVQKEKMVVPVETNIVEIEQIPTAVEMTVAKLDAMENAVLAMDANKLPTPPKTELIKIHETPTNAVKKDALPATVTNSVPNNALKYSSVLNRPVTARNPTKALITGRTNNPTTAKVNTALRRSATTVSGTSTNSIKPLNRAAAKPTVRNVTNTKTENFGPPTHVASRLSARSRTMLDMNKGHNTETQKLLKAKPLPLTTRSSNNSRRNSSQKSSREDVGSSSSTLKASNERITASRHNLITATERRSEPKQMHAEPNDGWLTVKNRRRSSMHWANRFNQPTGYASLPTLALLNEKRQEEEQKLQQKRQKLNEKEQEKKEKQKQAELQKQVNKTNTITAKGNKENEKEKAVDKEKMIKTNPNRPEIKAAKAKVNSLRKSATTTESAKVKTAPVPVTALPSRQTIIKRQRSDLTGLKITTLHKEYMRSEKNAQRRLNGQKLSVQEQLKVSSTESSTETIIDAKDKNLTNGTSSDMESSTEQVKIDIKIQTNNDFSKTIGDLYESIAKLNADIKTGILPICDETEEALVQDLDCDEDQRKLVEEQESLERQIRELENTEIDVDTETDETDCEVVLETEHEDDENGAEQALENASSSIVFVPVNEDANISLELRYQALLSEMSWGEREQTLATLQAYVSRHPGRAQELHQKLSTPSRRRSLHETLKKYQAKQARAQQKRELLQKEKAVKLQQLLARVEDVKAAKCRLIEDKRVKMEGRLQRAAENREQYLKQIIEKAHDEEKKLKEINFIKNIEAQNKRFDLLLSSKEAEVRLQDLEQERQKRMEEKAAKEAAVERRRQELEKERLRKLEKMHETRLEKEQRIGKMQEQKEQQRLALAREKARDREERLLALQVQQQQSTEELVRKILQKQKESARRHEENMEHIRQRALELTIPTRSTEENGKLSEDGKECNASSIDDGDLSSTVSDVGGREHSRGFKKKLKKLKQRMAASTEEYLKELDPLPAYLKRESQIPKYLNLVAKGGGAQGMERALGHLLVIVSKAQFQDFQCFLLMDGLGTITNHVILKALQEDTELSKKSLVMATQLYRNVCTCCPQIARHAIMGNTVAALFEVLLQAMQFPDELSPQHPVELSTELMLACTVTLAPTVTKKYTHPKMSERLPDLISYAVLIGLIDVMARRCMKVRESIENYPRVMLSLLTTIGFITRFVEICPQGPLDQTRFLSTAKSTDLFGSISMLYASVVPVGECIPPRTVSLAAAAFNLLVAFAALDLNTFQDILSTEPLSLKFFDVVLLLLKYCAVSGTDMKTEKAADSHAVIIDVVASLGFLCANNKKNQDLLVSDQYSIIVKSLTKLPAVFDSIVYPCLVTITLQNNNARNILSKDFNLNFLDEYSKSDTAKKNRLIQLVHEKQNKNSNNST